MKPTSSQMVLMLALSLPTILGCATHSQPHNQLALLLERSEPCRVRLDPPWKGVANFTVQTGHFSNSASPLVKARCCDLQFDWFNFFDQTVPLSGAGPRIISRASTGNKQNSLHTYRPDLPSDAELMKQTNWSGLTNLLGGSHYTDGWGGPEDDEFSYFREWQFFRFKGKSEIETLTVNCITIHHFSKVHGKVEREGKVDEIQIVRGTAKPE